MTPMTSVQITAPGGPFKIAHGPVPEPKPNTVRVKVQACGICHSDMFVKEGHWPGLHYPRVTGHEVAGVIDAVGAPEWWPGRKASVSGWGGMEGIVADVPRAIAAIFSVVRSSW